MIPGGAFSFLMGSAFGLTFTGALQNQNIATHAAANGWDGTTALVITIASGCVISSSSTGSPALTTGSIASGVPLRIINNGTIVGRGGDGGHGDNTRHSSDGGSAPAAGSAGGDALKIESACPITIVNSGFIYGGGGGGGGGAGNRDDDTNDPDHPGKWVVYGGGGGGAGYGGGTGGAGGVPAGPIYTGPSVQFDIDGGAGGNGSTTSLGGGGAGGSGESSSGVTGGAGGNGGAAGAAGSSTSSILIDSDGTHPGASGGAAGRAINLNGHSRPTFQSGDDSTHIKGAST